MLKKRELLLFKIFQVILKEDGTEIDDDEVLESFSQIISNFTQVPVLKVVRTNSNGEILLDANPNGFVSTSAHVDTGNCPYFCNFLNAQLINRNVYNS